MRSPKRSRAAEAFGPSFWVFTGLAGIAAWAVWELKGAVAVGDALSGDLDILLFLLPRMIGGMLLAGLVQAILPPDLVAKWVGEEHACRPFEWKDEFPPVAESSPELAAKTMEKWKHLLD